MHIVILDGYTENPGDLSWGELEKLGDLTVYDRTSLTDEDEIISRIGGAEVVLTNKTPISRRVMDACPSMRFIAMLATGYNVVDIACAKEKGIPVSNVPVYGTHSVSQFAIALLLEICHHIGYHNDTVKSGKWEQCPDWCYWDYPLIELAGKTYGLLGCGNIGIHTAAIASALGMNVIAYDMRQRDEALQLGVEYVSLDELFARSDVLGLQMPLFPFNTGIINRENIAKMKDGVIILNNSRGQPVVEQDMIVVSDTGEAWSPKMLPPNTAAAVSGTLTPRVMAMGRAMTEVMAMVPMEVPVASEIIQAMTNTRAGSSAGVSMDSKMDDR